MLAATGLPWLLLIVLTGVLVYLRYREADRIIKGARDIVETSEPAQMDEG